MYLTLITKSYRDLALRKKILIVFFTVFLSLIIGHWIAGYGYLLKGVAFSYLRGQSGPGINESHLFYNNIIHTQNPKPLPNSNKKKLAALNTSDINTLEEIETASFLVIENDSLIFENYWNEFSEKVPTNTFSASKSLVSLLIGIAIEEGYIESVDQSVGDFLADFSYGDKSKITIKNLLSMSSGLSWGESGGNPYSDNAKAYYGQNLSAQIKGLRVIEEPGKTFRYKSGDTQILVYVLEAATEVSISNYLEEKIWSKIGAENNASWNLDRENGDEKGFCCFYGIPRDYGKIGQLVLHKGKYNGQQIVPFDYLEKCLTVEKSIIEKDKTPNKRYGWQWWSANYKGNIIHYARGLLGQYIIIHPTKNMVIVRTGKKRKKVLSDGHPADLWDYLRMGETIANNLALK